MKYSLRTWLLVAAGLATACMAFANPILAELYYTIGLLLFAFGILAAIYRRGQRRAFWVGFSVLFGIYISLSTSSFLQYLQFAQMGGGRNVPTGLITSRLLGMVYEGLNPAEFSGRGRPSRPNAVGGYMAFLTMGHTLIAIALGVLGGQVAQRLSLSAAPANSQSLEEMLEKIDDE